MTGSAPKLKERKTLRGNVMTNFTKQETRKEQLWNVAECPARPDSQDWVRVGTGGACPVFWKQLSATGEASKARGGPGTCLQKQAP